jgi:hypothetical protein
MPRTRKITLKLPKNEMEEVQKALRSATNEVTNRSIFCVEYRDRAILLNNALRECNKVMKEDTNG